MECSISSFPLLLAIIKDNSIFPVSTMNILSDFSPGLKMISPGPKEHSLSLNARLLMASVEKLSLNSLIFPSILP